MFYGSLTERKKRLGTAIALNPGTTVRTMRISGHGDSLEDSGVLHVFRDMFERHIWIRMMIPSGKQT